jgi:hypothetical protein
LSFPPGSGGQVGKPELALLSLVLGWVKGPDAHQRPEHGESNEQKSDFEVVDDRIAGRRIGQGRAKMAGLGNAADQVADRPAKGDRNACRGAGYLVNPTATL